MNLLITGAFKYSQEQAKKIKSLGYDIINMPNESDDLPIDPKKLDGVICNGLFLHQDIKKFSNLKFIQLTSAGLDRVPLDYIKSNGINLYNARGVYSIPIAEWVVMRILEHFKDLEQFTLQQKKHEWIKHRDIREIYGSKIAIIGAGNIGQEIAKRLFVLGAIVTGFDIHENKVQFFEEVKLVSKFKQEVEKYDIIILTAPLTPETTHMIDSSILSSMKNEGLLINVSRGGLIDETALIKVFASRKNIHAALDVFEVEPLSVKSELWDMDNIKISPHNSFVGNGNQNRMFDVALKNLTIHANEK